MLLGVGQNGKIFIGRRRVEQDGISKRKDCFSPGHPVGLRKLQGFYLVTYLTNANQEVSDLLGDIFFVCFCRGKRLHLEVVISFILT